MEDAEDDIAVIGIGCNFPGGKTLDHFWRLLLEGKNCVADIPAERFDVSCWYDADSRKPGKTQTTKAALIEGFNEFDHKFFGITEVEAEFMDPQQKLLLQCTYRALEDAGMAMESISGSRTGVYIGLMNRDYEMLQSNSPTSTTHYSGTGAAMSVSANRISFTFNLTGPSFAIDSACSSSLVAVHLACQAIKQGDCEMALCGGVSCILEPRVFVALSKAKMISPEGTSKPFSNRADGYGRGEGCGVVLLKPLKKATKDFNKIWGIISKTAVNQDGRSVTPITKPSMVQQEELLRRIYSETDLANVQYIEAHGTGTPAGDATEAGSISNVIAKARPPGSETLRIGSVKSNIGHTESAAGVAGLIKVLLMMTHETFVPSVFYSEEGASVDVNALSISIPTKAVSWETDGSFRRVAGINSFGFGGTNAHVIIREHRQAVIPKQIPQGCTKLFVISAASEKSFTLTLTDTLQRLRSDRTADLQALSYTSACGRSHSRHKYRKAFLTSFLSDLEHQLASALKANVQPLRPDLQVVFVFCGNGVAYRAMCKQLLREAPVFRDKVREVEKVFQSHKSVGLSKWLSGDCDDDLRKPDVAQPLLFAIQVGIASLLKNSGIKPDAVLGHSVGEVAAAHCSGLLSLDDAVKVLYHRSALQGKVTGGKMLVVGNVAVEKVLQMLRAFSGKVYVAAFNSPQSCTLSGDGDAIDVLREKLKSLCADNLFLHVLDVPVAYHSHVMDPVLDEIERSIGVLDANNMECKLLSTVTGDWYSGDDFSSGTYWAKNVREPVLFEQALHAATKGKHPIRNAVFVEIGPRRALQRNICESLGSDAIVLPAAQPEKDYDTFLSTVGKLFELGINVDWRQLYGGYETLPTAFPIYHFDTLKKPLNFKDVRRGDELSACPPHMFITPKNYNNKEYICNLSVETVPYLWEHKNNGVAIVPGAFYVELAYASVMASLRPKKPTSLLQLSIAFESLFTLTSNCPQLKVTLKHDENVGSFEIQSHVTTHASGTYACTDGQPPLEEPTICIEAISQRCKMVMKRKEIYSILSQAGFEYGAVFKQLGDVHYGDEFREAVTKIQVVEELVKHLHDYFVHPVLLDYFLQMSAVVAIGRLTAKQGFPSVIGSVAISGPLQERMILYLRATRDTPDFLEVCGCFSTTEGRVLVELKGVRISFLGNCSNVSQSLFFHNEIIAVQKETGSKNGKLKAIVFEDMFGIAKGLRPYLHPESVTVESRDSWLPEDLQDFVYQSLETNVDFTDVLFTWAVENLSHLSSEKILDCLVTCCELFRHTVLALKRSGRVCTVRVITYRATEMVVDHVSPGSVLSGMTRACAAEMPGLSFQLIDLASVTGEDIQMLVRVLSTCRQQEVMISKGQATATRIARTPVKDGAPCEGAMQPVCLSNFVLQTTDPYRVAHLSAVPCHTNETAVQQRSVEIRLTSACAHSSDFFPVTTSHLTYGRTVYWNKNASKSHKLLALDFSGIVTAVGKDVRTLRVGDHIAACYPAPAAAKMILPEAACYSTERLPFLKETPCVSFFIVTWEVLQVTRRLIGQQHRKLVIIASNSASVLIKVLALAANRSGWCVSTLLHFKGEQMHLDQGDAFVFLPPFDPSWQLTCDNRGLDRHFIFVCGDHTPSTPPASMLSPESDRMHVHKLDVSNVLQKANLQAKNRSISKWLMSLGFVPESLPLKKETFQLSRTKEPQTDSGTESYFTTTTVQQVVLDHRESDCPVSDIPLLTSPGQLFKQGCVYIVTGGLSGLGLETVKFVAHNGGGCIATLSRRAPTDELRFEMERLRNRYGVAIINVKCDVSVWMQVLEAVSKIEQAFSSCPIKGVFHSAAVLHDALIETLDEAVFRKVLQPKVSGALNLHYATLHNKLDFFVCYSSISSFIGNASQCNYAAANSFLDTFCHYRRNLGLAGQSINWGPLNLGLLLNKDDFQKFLEAKGMMVMDVCEVHEVLKMCLKMNRAQQVICKFHFKNLNIHVLSQNASLRERLSPLVEMEVKDDISIEPSFQNLSSKLETVKTIVSNISNVGVDELDGDPALCALGIDSMLAMTLQNEIFQQMGANVPLVRILDPSSTLSTLVTIVLNSG